MTNETEKTYLQTRVYDTMGVTPEQNKVEVYCTDPEGSERKVSMPIFSSDKDD